DGIVYGAVASLGFATYENFLYVSDYGIGVAIRRAIMSVPGHAFMGAVMGYFAGQWKFGPANHRGRNLILAYVAPVALHWLYDFPLMAFERAASFTGKARELALHQVAPLEDIPVAILIIEAVAAIWLVSRMRKQQIRMTREIAAAAAAAGGATDLV